MKTKYISPIEYASLIGVHKSYIHRLLLENKTSLIPHIKSIKKYSRFYTLEVPIDFSKETINICK